MKQSAFTLKGLISECNQPFFYMSEKELPEWDTLDIYLNLTYN
jgi:hypothetical protein